MTNGIDQVTFVSNNNPIQRVIPYNFYKQLNVGTSHNYTFNKWNWLESNNSATLFYSKTTSDLENTLPKIEKWTVFLSSNNSFVINKTIKAELNFTYQSPAVAGSYTTNSWYYIDVGVRYTTPNKKLNIALNAMDIFRTNKVTFTQIVNGIKQKSYDYADTQKVRLSLSWNFGKQLKTEKRKQSNEEEKGRL